MHISHLRLYRTKQKNPSPTEHQPEHQPKYTQNKKNNKKRQKKKKKHTNIKTLVAQPLKFPNLVFTLTVEHLRCEAY